MNEGPDSRVRARRFMTGPYLARNPLVVGSMILSDLVGRFVPARAVSLPSDGPLKIVVANLAHLGDLIALLPLLKRLRAWERTAGLGLVIGSWSRNVLQLGELADQVHYVDHWRLSRADSGLAAKLRRHAQTRAIAVSEMRKASYDVAIDAYAYFGNSADLLWSAHVPTRIGFTSGGAGTLFTHRIPFDPHASMQANQARLLGPLLGDAELDRSTAQPFPIDRDAESKAKGLGDFVVLHVGPGNRHKDWPIEQWNSLGRMLIADGYRLVFTGAASDARHVGKLCAGLDGEDLLGKLSLRGLGTLLAGARGLVAIDTMVGHLAAPLHVPTVIVAPGITPPGLWRPSQPFVRSMTEVVPCAPCNRTLGCDAMPCVRGVKAERVHAALAELIGARSAARH